MEDRSERKWKTLRDIGSPQPESDSSPAKEEEEFPDVPAPGARHEEEGTKDGTPDPDEASDIPEPLQTEPAPGESRVLVVNPSSSTTRLIRESLENFTSTRVETTSDFLRAFELALQKRYRLFFFGMRIGEYGGPMLYELISMAYSTGYGSQRIAPAVVFVREKDDPKLPLELERDARVRGVLNKPIRIDRLLKSVEGALDVRDPTAG